MFIVRLSNYSPTKSNYLPETPMERWQPFFQDDVQVKTLAYPEFHPTKKKYTQEDLQRTTFMPGYPKEEDIETEEERQARLLDEEYVIVQMPEKKKKKKANKKNKDDTKRFGRHKKRKIVKQMH